jgi:hypothetical protein
MSKGVSTAVGDQGLRHIFVVEADAVGDTLARVLGPFIVADAAVLRLDYQADGPGAVVRIEVGELTQARAQLIQRRLEGVPAVRRVGRGWR